MRRLTADELVAVASELGAQVAGDVYRLADAQRVDGAIEGSIDGVVDALAALLVAVVGQRPFDRRNHAVAVAAIDLLAHLNGHALDLAPPEDVAAMIAKIRDGLAAGDVRDWLSARTALAAPTLRPRCPACSMPLREGLAAVPVGLATLPTCGGCGHLLAPSVRHPFQEV